MTLPEILKMIRQWWWILLITPFIAGATAYFVSSSMTEIFEAEATAIIEHPMAGGVASDLQSIQAAERRTQTLSRLVTTRAVLEPVTEELGLLRSVEELRGAVTVSSVRETQLVTISVQDPEPERAAEIANAIANQFSDFVEEMQAPAVAEPDAEFADIIAQIDEQIELTEDRIAELEAADGPESDDEIVELAELEDSLIQLQQTGASLESIQGSITSDPGAAGSVVRVVEPAAPPTGPVSPRTMLNTALAGFLGLLIGGALVVGLSWIDDNVKTEGDVRALTDRPVIGAIPQEDFPEKMESIHAGRSLSGEIFRGLRTNLQFIMVDREVKSIAISSVGPSDGKTTVAANLAIVLAQGGQRVILVDADLRRPRVHGLFHRVRNDRGLSNLLLQSPAVIEDVLQSTSINNLKVLTSGPLPPNPPDLMGSARMRTIVDGLEDTGDIVIFDSPPVAISEALLLSSLTDGMLFVIRAGNHRTAEVVQGFEAASQTGVPLLGVVLNAIPWDSRAAYRVYQQYYRAVEDDAPPPRTRFGRLSRMFSRGS